MRKFHKQLKKLFILMASLTLMMSSGIVSLAADSDYEAVKEPGTAMTALSVFRDGKSTTSLTLYTNGDNEELKKGLAENSGQSSAVSAAQKEVVLDVNAVVGTGSNKGKGGSYTVTSNNQSVASVKRGTDKSYYQITIKAGNTNGTANITVKDLNGKKSATVKVTVKTLTEDIELGSNVKADGAGALTLDLGTGGKLALGAKAANPNASAPALKYKSNDTTIATVDNKTGVVTAKKKTGTTTVEVWAQDQPYTYIKSNNKAANGTTYTLKKTITVNVKAAEESYFFLTGEAANSATKAPKQGSIALKTNAGKNTYNFGVFMTNKSNAIQPSTKYTFTSSNEAVAKVDKNGKITAVANPKGKTATAVITAVPADGTTAKRKVSVKVTVSTDLESINVPNDTITVLTGKSVKIGATANGAVTTTALEYKPNTYNDNKGSEGKVSLDKPTKEELALFNKIATVNAKNGTIKGVKEGTVTVLVRGTKENADITRTVTINVVDPITTLTASVNPYPYMWGAGKKTTLYVDPGAEDREEIPGAADILGTSKLDYGSMKVNVQVRDRKGNVAGDDIANKVTFASNKPAVAAVDAQGNITAKSKGTATITVTAKDGSNKKATVTVTVIQPVTSISIANAEKVSVDKDASHWKFYAAGKTAKATLNAVTNANANDKNLAYSFELNNNSAVADTFKSYSKNVLTLDTKQYVATEGPELLGTYTITANNVIPTLLQKGVKAEVEVYLVAEKTYAAGVAISQDKDEKPTLKKGEVLPLSAEIWSSGKDEEHVDNVTERVLTWKSGNTKSVTVDKNGVVTAKNVGTAGVTATAPVEPAAKGQPKNPTYSDTLDIRVVQSDAEFANALDTKVKNLVNTEANNVNVWSGMKPAFDAKTSTLNLTINDLGVGKTEAKDAKEAIEALLTAIKETVLDSDTASYKEFIIKEGTAAGWKIERSVDGKSVVFEGESYRDITEAIKALAESMTKDAEDMVDWAGRSLTVEFTKEDAFVGFETVAYTKSYDINFNVDAATVDSLIDARIAKALDAHKYDDLTAAGIYKINYNASTNTMLLDVYDEKVKIADASDILKKDSAAAAEIRDIFAEAVNADVTAKIDLREVSQRFDNFDDLESKIDTLVDKLNKAGIYEMGMLRSGSVSARVTFEFNGKSFVQTYNVVFDRSLEAVDSKVDAEIISTIPEINEQEKTPVTVEYDAESNEITVGVKDITRNDISGLGIGTLVSSVLTDGPQKAQISFMDQSKTLESKDLVSKDTIREAVHNFFMAQTNVTELGDLLNRRMILTVTYEQGTIKYTINFEEAVDLDAVKAEIDAAIDSNAQSKLSDVLQYNVIENAVYNAENNGLSVTLANNKSESEINDLTDGRIYKLVESVLKIEDYPLSNIVFKVGEKEKTFTFEELDVNSTETTLVSFIKNEVGLVKVGDLVGQRILVTLEYKVGTSKVSIEYAVDFVLGEAKTNLQMEEISEESVEDTEVTEEPLETSETDEIVEPEEITEEVETIESETEESVVLEVETDAEAEVDADAA